MRSRRESFLLVFMARRIHIRYIMHCVSVCVKHVWRRDHYLCIHMPLGDVINNQCIIECQGSTQQHARVSLRLEVHFSL